MTLGIPKHAIEAAARIRAQRDLESPNDIGRVIYEAEEPRQIHDLENPVRDLVPVKAFAELLRKLKNGKIDELEDLC